MANNWVNFVCMEESHKRKYMRKSFNGFTFFRLTHCGIHYMLVACAAHSRNEVWRSLSTSRRRLWSGTWRGSRTTTGPTCRTTTAHTPPTSRSPVTSCSPCPRCMYVRTVKWLLRYSDFSRLFSARCNIYISRLCYDVSVRLSVCDGSALAHYS